PVWMAIQRFLKRHGEFNDSERHALDVYFGTKEWATVFYTNISQQNLFGDGISRLKSKVSNSGPLLVRWYRSRLKQLFAHVSSARLIKSARGRNLYCLIHAAHNPKGGKIANAILRQGEVIE
ncbi:MAG: hypothetical protein ACJ8KO_09530, partial [Sulfurifustaceae bacterium]